MGRKPKSATVERPANATDNVSPVEIMEKERHEEISRSSPSKKKAPKDMNVVVRRSGRLKNLVSSRPSNEVALEKVDLVDSDDEPPHMDELNSEPSLGEGGMKEKIDFLVQSAVKLNARSRKRNSSNKQKSEEINYKELYLGTQRKIDCLIEANHELTKKLEFTRGKVEAYELMKDAFANSNLAKVVEAVVNISSQAGTAARCNLPVVSPTPPPPPPPPPPPSTNNNNNNNNNNDNSRVVASRTPAANNNNNNDNLQVVASPTPAANVDEPMTSAEKSQRGRKKSRRC